MTVRTVADGLAVSFNEAYSSMQQRMGRYSCSLKDCSSGNVMGSLAERCCLKEGFDASPSFRCLDEPDMFGAQLPS